ncbi:MAG: ATP-binding protein [Crocosphaera sp.]
MDSSGLSHAYYNSYHICLTNKHEELEKLSDWVNILAEQLDISPKIVFRLDLILAEIITNIIDYGYDDDQEHSIQLKLKYDQGKITIKIEDDGIPFNPLNDHAVELANDLESAKIGGLGIHLMREYTDECNYQRIDSNNCLELVIFPDQEKRLHR